MTALTPAQVRDHARALILEYARDRNPLTIAEWLTADLDPDDGDGTGDYPTDVEIDTMIAAIADAIRTARITVDWDEETK